MEANMVRPLIKMNPKAKPLALTLIAAAAEQGASFKDFMLACDIAKWAYERALNTSTVVLSEFQGEVEATLNSL